MSGGIFSGRWEEDQAAGGEEEGGLEAPVLWLFGAVGGEVGVSKDVTSGAKAPIPRGTPLSRTRELEGWFLVGVAEED